MIEGLKNLLRVNRKKKKFQKIWKNKYPKIKKLLQKKLKPMPCNLFIYLLLNYSLFYLLNRLYILNLYYFNYFRIDNEY